MNPLQPANAKVRTVARRDGHTKRGRVPMAFEIVDCELYSVITAA
jgi:hypothetical protein